LYFRRKKMAKDRGKGKDKGMVKKEKKDKKKAPVAPSAVKP
jgi:hypothetical protein